jgi:hypothetical protein
MPAEPPANPTLVGAAAVFLFPRPAEMIVWDTSEKKGDTRPCHTYSHLSNKSFAAGDG